MSSFPDDEDFLRQLSEELATPHLILGLKKKKSFALLSGILPEKDLDPDPDGFYPDGFSKFFDGLIDVTFHQNDQNRANLLFTRLLDGIMRYLKFGEEELEGLLKVSQICDEIRTGDIEESYPGFTGFALDVFGGYVEFLFLLCLAGTDRDGNQRDCEELQRLIEKRFGDSHQEYNIPYLKRAHSIFDHIGVAPVYVRGRQRVGDSDYLTLQLVSECKASLERLHTTFSILIDEDTPSFPDLGTYRQVKLYGGMRDLRRGQSDSLPIVLNNAKIIPKGENVRWK